MRRYLLLVAPVLIVILLIGGVWFSETPQRADAALSHQTMVNNMNAFELFVEFRHEGIGTIVTAVCPPNGSDPIDELIPGEHVVSAWRTDNGNLFTQRRIEIDEMHRMITIHTNGNITPQQ